MPRYAPGMRVIIRDEEWLVKKCITNSYGSTTLMCYGISPLVRDCQAYFLSDLEKVEIVDPLRTRLAPDTSSCHARARLFLESQWRQRIPTDARLHIGHRAVMNVLPYQLEPAKVSLKRPKQRILIADAVGLGKTLEAGILMSELIERGKGRRILVVTVKSMMAQFQKEMWERFTIPLISLDSAAIARIRRDMPSNHNPFHYYDKTIVSIDTIKRDVEYRAYLENATWHIIVIDEAHNVARRGNTIAQRARLASLLSTRSDALIMLSATPHDGSARSFASLMNMLDPTAIPDPDNYTEADIKDSSDDIKGLFMRRFKKDVQSQTEGQFMERHVSQEECWASPKEEAALDAFVEFEKLIEDGSGIQTMSFKKGIFSSPAACLMSLRHRLRKLEGRQGKAAMRERQAIGALCEALKGIEPQDFTRYTRLLELLRSREYDWNPRRSDDRLVIFTERIETMRWLQEHLRADLNLPDDAVQELHGGMSDIEQQQIVEKFGRDSAPVRVLVASDVASEGLNLHYLCHRLIHFDIPWSLMIFQQRNGRIDRYGQTREPDIRYMVIRTRNEKISVDTRILQVLIRKEEQASKNIGDPALLMKVYDSRKEDELTARAMAGGDVEAFDDALVADEDFDIFAYYGADGESDEAAPEPAQSDIADDHTLMSDYDYLRALLHELSREQRLSVEEMQNVKGLTVGMTEDMRRVFRNILPREALPTDGYLRLSPDREFCAQQNRLSLQNPLEENAWPRVHYLWKLHPIMRWADDRAVQFFARQEAPLVCLPGRLRDGERIFCVNGTIPNRQGTPLVDEWFALRFEGDKFTGRMTMEEMIARTGFGNVNLPNIGGMNADERDECGKLLPEVVAQAKRIMTAKYEEYRIHANEVIEAELNKLAGLEGRHKRRIQEKYEQLTMAGVQQRRDREERQIDELFNEFTRWVHERLEIEDTPNLRVLAAFTGKL